MKKLLIISILILCSCQSNQNSFKSVNPDKTIETITLLGDTLVSPDINDGKSFEQFKSAQINYFENLQLIFSHHRLKFQLLQNYALQLSLMYLYNNFR